MLLLNLHRQFSTLLVLELAHSTSLKLNLAFILIIRKQAALFTSFKYYNLCPFCSFSLLAFLLLVPFFFVDFV